MAKESAETDVVLIGGGIMSATLGILLRQVRPDWSITAYERHDEVGAESSYAWNNAGTGHAGLCELNYTPERADGSIDTTKAVLVNEQFQESLQFWASLVDRGHLPEASRFVNPIPHMSYVRGQDDVRFLHKRCDALAGKPLFEDLQLTEDPQEIAEWAPLMMTGRDPREFIALSRSENGTDVNFGALTKHLFAALERQGINVVTKTEVENLERTLDGRWVVTARARDTGERIRRTAQFVFIGAGGHAIHLLQKSGIPEARGYGGFPVSGQFLRCTDSEVIEDHHAKVYGKPQAKAPPMSMPHLDRRTVDGEASVLFGPYAGFTPRFLKRGSYTDLFRSIKADNLPTMLTVAKEERDLTKYLIGQVIQKHESRMEVLRDFVPTAEAGDWQLIHAGQRVQTMKRTADSRGAIVFGTETVCSQDGSIAGLLGASPGASTAVSIMLDVLRQCFPEEYSGWSPKLRELIPSAGVSLSDDPMLLDDVREMVTRVLGVGAQQTQEASASEAAAGLPS